jgi:26S proteasome regulatory subunit N9
VRSLYCLLLSYQSLIDSGPTDPAQHLEFLTDLLSRITKDKSPDAHVLVLSTLAHAKLLFGDLEGSKTDIDAAWKILDNTDAVENSVNGAYYRVAADYYKVRATCNIEVLRRLSKCRIEQVNAEYAPYYRNSLLYLACVDLEKDMSQDERLLRAHDLAVSAFLAETIYNFGELVCPSADCEPRTTLIFAAFLMWWIGVA